MAKANRGWLESIKETGVEVKALDRIPEVLPHARMFWTAYNHLTRGRVWSDGRPRTIPMSEVQAYTTMFKWDTEDIETLLAVMDSCEAVYFEWVDREQKKQKRKGANSQRAKGGRR